MTPMRTIGIKILVNGIALWVAALVLSDGIHLGQHADSAQREAADDPRRGGRSSGW